MRAPLLLSALIALVAAAPTKDWRATATLTPAGAVAVGNPAAPVKLVEYLSFTCPHCGHLVAESKAALHDGFVRSGSVRVETRAAVRDPYDLAAWTLARCGGAARFTRLSSAIFAGQEGWMTKGGDWAKANLAKLQAMPQRAQTRALIDNSGLAQIGQAAGVTRAALTQCLATDAQTKQLIAMTDAAFKKVNSTPSAEVNGELIDGVSWTTLEPKLRAAGAR